LLLLLLLMLLLLELLLPSGDVLCYASGWAAHPSLCS
jgi:membrane protein YqaA with SNARE-associated domain